MSALGRCPGSRQTHSSCYAFKYLVRMDRCSPKECFGAEACWDMQRVVTYPKSSPVVRGLSACGMEADVDNPPETSLLALTCAGEREAAHGGRLQSCWKTRLSQQPGNVFEIAHGPGRDKAWAGKTELCDNEVSLQCTGLQAGGSTCHLNRDGWHRCHLYCVSGCCCAQVLQGSS